MFRPGSLIQMIDINTGDGFGKIGLVIGFVRNTWQNKTWIFVKVLWSDMTQSLYSPEGLKEIGI